jgi:hypothetical protein
MFSIAPGETISVRVGPKAEGRGATSAAARVCPATLALILSDTGMRFADI